MGFFDFLFNKGTNKEQGGDRKIAKLRKSLTHMYVQAHERQYALQQLRNIGTPEAVEAILARFEENAPNTTVDAEEKEMTYALLVEMATGGQLNVAEIVKEHLRKAEEKINWPMRVLSDLLSLDEMTQVVEELLASCTTAYQRNPEKKQELILRATEFKSDELARQVVRFLGDDNETIRFLAVDAALAQQRDAMVEEPLRARLTEEDSGRILTKLAEAFAERPEWKIPEDEKEAVAGALPAGFSVGKDGVIKGSAR